MSLKAYVRYDNTERIVPGGPIVTSVKPKVGDWVAVDDVLVTTTASNYKLRGFIRYLKNGNYVAGSLILQHNAPKDGNWKEVYVINPACCGATTTYYNVAGCERMEYHVIAYTGVGVLAEGTIVNNATPECWFIVDQTTGPEDVGTITYIWDTPFDCQPCINSHTTTTTTSSSTSTTTSTTTAAPFYSFILNTVPRYIEFGLTGCDACSSYSGGPFVTMYSNVSTLTTGSIIYNDPGLTSPFSGAGTDAWYAIDNNGNISYTQIGRIADGNTGLIFNGPVSCSTC
jgi:hypothetical protein